MDTKQSKSKTAVGEITDEQITKSLDRLQRQIRKSDALENRDTEGDLSTEGEALSAKAKQGGKGKISKNASATDQSESADESSEDVKKGEDEDDASESSSVEESDDEASPDMPPVKKGKKVAKSLLDRAEDRQDLQKGFAVNSFLSELGETLSDTIEGHERVIRKGLGKLEENGDDLRKSVDDIREDQGLIKKGLYILAQGMTRVDELLTQIAKQPAGDGRPRAMISKSEIAEPSRLNGDGDGGGVSTAEQEKFVTDWLAENIAKGEVPAPAMAAWEQFKHLDFLPTGIANRVKDAFNKAHPAH